MEVLAQACLQGSAMALVLLAARALLSRLLPRWVFPALWVVVLVRLLLPIDLSARKAISGSVEEAEQILHATENPAGIIVESVDRVAEAIFLQGAPWGLVWAAGSAVALLVLVVLYGIQSRALRGAKSAAPVQILEPWLASHRLRRNLRVLESCVTRTPVARGFLRPSIVVPTGYLNGDRKKVEAALEHEFAHIRRFDPTVRALALLIACIYWFNPITWITYFSLSRDQELACDESALRRLGNEARRPYAEALLDAADAVSKPGVCGTGFGQAPLEERVRRIVSPVRRRPVSAAVAAGAVCLAVTGAALCASPPPVATVSVGDCVLELPSYWRGRVEVRFEEDGSSVSICPAGHPELFLVELVETDGSGDPRVETDARKMLWSGRSSDGRTYELWGLCYAGMSTENAWKEGPFSNPPYPGEEAEREAVDLSTGGTVTVDEARLHLKVDCSWFDFYYEEIATGIELS